MAKNVKKVEGDMTEEDKVIAQIKADAAEMIKKVRQAKKTNRLPSMIDEAIAMLEELRKDNRGVLTLSIHVKTESSPKSYVSLRALVEADRVDE